MVDADSSSERAGTVELAPDLAEQLSRLAKALQKDRDLGATLETVVGAALELIPGAAAGSISVVEQRRNLRSEAPSSDLPVRFDRMQGELDEGPCLDSVWEEKTVRVNDFGQESERWPRLAPAAVAAGVRSMLCFQLFVEGDNLGALNIIGSEPDAFDQESEDIGLLIAAHASVAFADAKQISQLQQAIDTRDLIGQAKGILMERYRITSQQAFLVLATASRNTNRKLRDVAGHLASTGELPGGAERTPG